jgi:hypothetical protein
VKDKEEKMCWQCLQTTVLTALKQQSSLSSLTVTNKMQHEMDGRLQQIDEATAEEGNNKNKVA